MLANDLKRVYKILCATISYIQTFIKTLTSSSSSFQVFNYVVIFGLCVYCETRTRMRWDEFCILKCLKLFEEPDTFLCVLNSLFFGLGRKLLLLFGCTVWLHTVSTECSLVAITLFLFDPNIYP